MLSCGGTRYAFLACAILLFAGIIIPAQFISVPSHLITLARVHAGVERAYFSVSLFALCSAAGRIVAGYLSDRIGRRRAMSGVFSAIGFAGVGPWFAGVLFERYGTFHPALMVLSIMCSVAIALAVTLPRRPLAAPGVAGP